MVSRTDVPFGLQHLNLIFSHIFQKIRENQDISHEDTCWSSTEVTNTYFITK